LMHAVRMAAAANSRTFLDLDSNLSTIVRIPEDCLWCIPKAGVGTKRALVTTTMRNQTSKIHVKKSQIQTLKESRQKVSHKIFAYVSSNSHNPTVNSHEQGSHPHLGSTTQTAELKSGAFARAGTSTAEEPKLCATVNALFHGKPQRLTRRYDCAQIRRLIPYNRNKERNDVVSMHRVSNRTAAVIPDPRHTSHT